MKFAIGKRGEAARVILMTSRKKDIEGNIGRREVAVEFSGRHDQNLIATISEDGKSVSFEPKNKD